ncbi:cytosolic carboxypeptidase Nna1 isoform X3 [Musca domestica]|uniref:Cytosolic carboxypeptidase Nna1 isoform X3 n=1 Tax=Musca domestica TaxID=7370 RepID=A0ABM3UX17_MUSDO|nr:cytosolic carboxypeptidase Nna1 isoform X3 [Musca domestica]
MLRINNIQHGLRIQHDGYYYKNYLEKILSEETGFLGSFLSKGLKTNQLEVNTDEKTLRPIARLKEPRDLFALPKDKDNDCSQQAPRWPIECQVIEERIVHIPTVPAQPEPFYQPTGKELKPNPVGEENGIVVFNYNPISAVNYDKSARSSSNKNHNDDDSSDSDVSSCESQGSTPDLKTPKRLDKNTHLITKLLTTLEQRSSSNSNEEEEDEEEEDDEDTENENEQENDEEGRTWAEENPITQEEIEDIWADKSPEYRAATPTYIRKQFGKDVIAQKYGKVGSKTKKRQRKPIELEQDLMAGLQVEFSRTSLDPNPDNDKPSPSNEYAKLKANPIFNPDMSLNLNELARQSENTSLNSCRKSSNWLSKSKRPQQQSANMEIPQPFSANYSSSSSCSPQSREHSVSPMYGPQSHQITCCSDAPCSCSCTNLNSKLNCKQNFQIKPKAGGEEEEYDDEIENLNLRKSIHDSKSSTKSLHSYLPQFSRSAVGGSKFLTNCHPYNPEEYDGLEFESRFESGNLAKAVQITPAYYELYLRPDLYTSRSRQWFYFRVRKTKRNMLYRFSIVNLIKSDSLYNDGMRPLMYSTHNAKTRNEGWVRCGDNICYYRNDDDNQTSEEEEDNSSYTLTFNIEFEHDNDTVYFAHSYPYTYSDLQDYLMEIQKNPVKSKFCKLRLLCRTLAGNNVYYLTVTTPAVTEELMKRKKSIVISARVHPSETPSSWMMKGLMDFITGDSTVAKRLRHKFIFKLIPMLNPDGVIVGNSRNSLTGKDLNRQYRTVIRETYPSIWYTKALIKRLIDECGVSMYCDMHAHSRRHNIFIYGCENKRNPEKKLTEQVFPLMLHKNVADKFSFENCKFKIQRSKEGTGRIVVWMLGITNSYTIEASFGGSLLGSRKGTHFTTQDYEHMGRAFCETLLDYCDDNPNKECLRLKIIERLLKEGSSAEEPINIPLSDYSSDEGSSSSSDNEGKGPSSSKDFSDLEGPCCHPLKAPPCSPELDMEIRKFKYSRMRKIMQELDRIYFQPLFHKKCQFLQKSRRPTPPVIIRSRPKIKNNLKMPLKSKSKINIKQKPFHSKIRRNDNLSTSPSQSTLTNSKITLQCVRPISDSASSSSLNTLKGGNSQGELVKKKRRKGGHCRPMANAKPRLKVSRALRLWLEKRQIIIIRRKLPHKAKMRCKSLHRRKKEERLLLDLPTTDPGSDLVFSTDDEYVMDSNGVQQCYGTIPRHIRRGLLQSELQRRYIEEIGDGLRNMPPELIITSPSNKTKHPPIKVLLKPSTTTKKYVAPPKSAELPMIGEPARRTSSWHNLNTAPQTPITPQWYSMNVTRRQQSPAVTTPKPVFKTKSMAKKEALSKEDLEIKLSLKKKIWTGIQPEDGPYGLDRSRPLTWVPPPPLKTPTKKSVDHKRADCARNVLRLENEAFLTACSQKLLEWQSINSNEEETPRDSQNSKLPMSLMMPELNEDHTMRIFKHLANMKKPTKPKSDTETKTKQKRNIITKVAETTTFLTKISKNKSRSTMAVGTYRSTVNKQTNTTGGGNPNGVGGQQHNRIHTRNPSKFKTGGIVATAVQTSNTKNKAKKSKAHKLNNIQEVTSEIRPSTSSGGALVLASTATTLVRKVKTKLKKKKSSSTTNSQNAATNTNNSSTVAKDGIVTYISAKAAGSCSS